MAKRQSHQRAPKQAIRTLESALRKLEHYNDPESPKCAVPAAAREDSRIYLDTWVAAPLAIALEYLRGEKSECEWL